MAECAFLCVTRGARADNVGSEQSYPSPLNYNHFPKSVCTSPNEVICHGIPDQRVLLDGDILNLDVTLYHEGYHGDLNETYYVGDKAKADPDAVRVVETARECLDLAIQAVKPGTPIREFGNIIEKHAKSKNCSTIRTYCGHGINTLFHCAPNVPHYAKNKTPGEAKPGMTFTIEPMIALGSYRDITWPDNWTSTTIDGKRTAQFGTLESNPFIIHEFLDGPRDPEQRWLTSPVPEADDSGPTRANFNPEHTLLVTETGVEVLTARKEDSPGGPIPMPTKAGENGESKE